jgi:hypothetical protein
VNGRLRGSFPALNFSAFFGPYLRLAQQQTAANPPASIEAPNANFQIISGAKLHQIVFASVKHRRSQSDTVAIESPENPTAV